MKSLEELQLYGTRISELPPSFGNLTGMIQLVLGNLEAGAGHLHIPGSIYNLQRLERLYLHGNFTFLKDMELLRNSYGGFSKYAFPSLNRIHLNAVPNPSEMDFILNYCCPPSLERLWIHDCKIVTFPKITGRLRFLHLLNIKLCNELGDIPSLPQSVRSAQTSEIFVQIREMIRLPPNLPPNSSSTISPAFVPSRPQSSLHKLFEDLNLGDRNLVQIFCETSVDAGKIAPVITRAGVYVECICSPHKSQGSQISKSIVQRNRRRPALLHGSSFIMRKQYNTKRSTRRPTSVHSSNSDSPIISRALNGGGSSSVSMSSNSWLSLDVTNWSEFDFGFESTLGDGFNLGSSSLNDDSDFSPFPQSKKMRPS
ncbi:hypothetical protein CMV_018907 [Castanea mollissima]|uniref:Uncharacterized protein n=1 Tax=Castanea mollissima TaxID=60419 RepID=A0A8J4QR06_9ROSI|nr:hypothetical protein CMV_018907 [Castanea mollissima]